MRALTILLSGFAFGAGLALSGMANPQRVLGFLDVAGDWDPTLAFVMAGAVAVFRSGWAFLRKKRQRGFFGCSLPDLSADPISKSLLVGAVLFGIGWGVGGFCPGPALANLGLLRPEAFVFTATMLAGMVLARISCGTDRN